MPTVAYLSAGAAAFALLLAAPVAVGAALRVLEAADGKPPFGVELRRHAVWALLWTVLGFAPAVIAIRASGQSGPAWAAAALAAAAVAFMRIGMRRCAGPAPSRVLWGLLEAVLVVAGLFLFDSVLDAFPI